jgi:hypothetical protein
MIGPLRNENLYTLLNIIFKFIKNICKLYFRLEIDFSIGPESLMTAYMNVHIIIIVRREILRIDQTL